MEFLLSIFFLEWDTGMWTHFGKIIVMRCWCECMQKYKLTEIQTAKKRATPAPLSQQTFPHNIHTQRFQQSLCSTCTYARKPTWPTCKEWCIHVNKSIIITLSIFPGEGFANWCVLKKDLQTHGFTASALPVCVLWEIYFSWNELRTLLRAGVTQSSFLLQLVAR